MRLVLPRAVADPGKEGNAGQEDDASRYGIGKQDCPNRKIIDIQDNGNAGSAEHSDQYQA